MRKKLDTGFTLRDICGGEYECGEAKISYIFNPDISQEERCKKCINGPKDNCMRIDNEHCIEEKYYRTKGISNKGIENRSMFGIIDINKLAEGCKDMCIYYKKNCYNTEKKHCLLRILIGEMQFE